MSSSIDDLDESGHFFSANEHGMGVSSSFSEDNAAFTRPELLDLLEGQYLFEPCRTLATAIHSLPSEDVAFVRQSLEQVYTDVVEEVDTVPGIGRHDWNRCLNLYSLDVLKSLYSNLLATSFAHLVEVEESLAYWEKHVDQPGTLFLLHPGYWTSHTGKVLEIGLLPWVSHMVVRHRHRIEAVIRVLDGHRLGTLDQIGLFHYRLNELALISTIDAETPFLESYVKELNDVVYGQDARGVAATKNASQMVAALRDISFTIASEYTARLARGGSVGPYGMPSHWRRQWPVYLGASVALTSLGLYVYRDWENIKESARVAASVSSVVVHEHVVRPFQDIVDYAMHLYGRPERVPLESIELNHDALDTMIRGFRPDLSDPSMGDVMSKYALLVNRPLLSAPTIVSALLIQGQKMKVDVEGIMVKLEDVVEANSINFALLMLIPTAFFSYAISRGIKYVFGGASNRTTSLKKTMREKLRMLEMLLIDRFHAERLSHLDMGSLLYITRSLQQAAAELLDFEAFDAFQDDLEKLKAVGMTSPQKLQIVNRLYRTHSFLSVSPTVV